MEKSEAQQLLNRTGSAFTTDEWRILKSLLTAETDPTLPALAEYSSRNAGLLKSVLTRRALCTWALHACPSLREAPEDVRAVLTRAAEYEFAACAQRKVAMHQLEQLAGQHGCAPLIIKGAANALLYYEKESLRPSSDIDIVMPIEAMAECFRDWASLPLATAPPEAWVHPPPFRVAGYPVELHACFISPGLWGRPGDLDTNSRLLRGHTHLRTPGTAEAFTLALLHFTRHFGGFTFDLLDMTRLLSSRELDGERAAALWRQHGIVHLVLPGLTVLDTIAPAISDAAWHELFHALPRARQREVTHGIRLLATRRFTKLRKEWFNARFQPPSFSHRAARLFLGSKALTRERCGRTPRHPLFWYFHLLHLPLKRIASLWK